MRNITNIYEMWKIFLSVQLGTFLPMFSTSGSMLNWVGFPGYYTIITNKGFVFLTNIKNPQFKEFLLFVIYDIKQVMNIEKIIKECSGKAFIIWVNVAKDQFSTGTLQVQEVSWNVLHNDE